MKVRRDIGSIPLRSAEDTWQVIRRLVTGAGSVDSGQLDAAATVMASLISDEAYEEEPLTLAGVSHRLVVYLRHGPKALEHGAAVDPLAWNPTAGDWTFFVPCLDEQFDWAKKTLASRAPRFTVLKYGDKPEGDDGQASRTEALSVDWGVFDR